uniref:Uncharacterized protein n=1 Tax=Rhizophora mucronata TaxID=61149 RepID=A0A2P2R3K2_RHIMU
MYYFPYLL